MENKFKNLNAVELKNKAVELKKKLAEVKFDKATGKLVNTNLPNELKRQIARVMTQISLK